MNTRPIIMLDFDEVIVLNRPGDFGGFDVISRNPPPGLWERLFHQPAVQTLVQAITEHHAQVVITTSWLRFMTRDAFEDLFKKTALEVLSENLHGAWEALPERSDTRAQAIDRWLAANHRGEPYVILDDDRSGTGLRNSVHDRRKRVIFCEMDVGLEPGHLPFMRAALTRVP